jgi:pilus assembly protein CpaF
LLNDPDVLEILIDGYDRVYAEKKGKLQDVPSPFTSQEHLLEFVHNLVTPPGGEIKQIPPLVDTRLPDGSRVNIVMPPISLTGPTLTIRKLAEDPLTMADVLRFGSLDEDFVTFLRACVRARLNIIVAGGTGSGKTTILRLIAEMIPDGERIIIVQTDEGLQRLPQKYVVTLESGLPSIAGEGEVTLRDLVLNALKMRPDRIIVGELQGSEAMPLLDAMNRGLDGSLASLHANSPRDALARIENMVVYSDSSLPLLNVRQQIASAVHLIVNQRRLPDGRRKIVKITEVTGMQRDTIELQDIFEFRQTGIENGKIKGHFTATGYIPKFLEWMQPAGIDVPLSLFTPRQDGTEA